MITIHIATYSVIRLLPNFIKNVTATLGDLKDEEKKKSHRGLQKLTMSFSAIPK